jgi:membrane protease YdiL (CAAX protease family)
MTLLDHLLMVVLVVALPLEGYFEFRNMLASLKRGDEAARSRVLVRTIVLQWSLAFALLAGWQSAGRAWGGVGLAVDWGWRAGVGAAGVALTLWLVWAQRRGVRRLSPERLQRLIARTGDTVLLLPATPGEKRIFAATAITAGVCEELLCRGFVFWYLGHWMSPWAAVAVASVPFALAHSYQGPKGAVRTGVVALVIGSLYVLTGSLLWPMLVHAVIDLGGGMLGELLRRPPPVQAGTAAPQPG